MGRPEDKLRIAGVALHADHKAFAIGDRARAPTETLAPNSYFLCALPLPLAMHATSGACRAYSLF